MAFVMAFLKTFAFNYFSMIKSPRTFGEHFYIQLTAGFILFVLIYLAWVVLSRRLNLATRTAQFNAFMWLVVAFQIGFLFFFSGPPSGYSIFINFFSMIIAAFLFWYYQPLYHLFFDEKEKIRHYAVSA